MAVHPQAHEEAPGGGFRARVGGDPIGSFQELRETAARFRALVERIPAITYTKVDDPASPTGRRVTYVSPQVTAVLGYEPDELLADPDLWDRITHPDDVEPMLAEERRVEETREPFRAEYRMFARDGRLVWLRDEATHFKDQETGLFLRQGFMLDVTEERAGRERVREAELLYRSLVETLPAMVFVDLMDEHATNLYTGPQTTEMLGYTPEEWQADPDIWLRRLVHPDDRERMAAAQQRHLEEGGRFDEVYRMVTKADRVLWVRDVADVVRTEDGTALYSQGFLLDVTAQKVAEGALHDALAREREVTERLRELDELKNTLLHTISHDLQSPLAAIVGAVATLTRSELDLPAELQLDLLEGMARRARKMSAFLRDLLDLDRLDQGIIEPNRVHVDVTRLVADTAHSCDALGGRAVEVGTGEAIGFIDESKVERIAENLLVNAARYTPEDGRIWARAERVTDGVLLVVEDEGPGVPDSDKEGIFERFRRGPDASGIPGTGLGLSLVSRFAALHGGRAWVEDRAGGGASFRVFLPDLPPADPDARAPASTTRQEG